MKKLRRHDRRIVAAIAVSAPVIATAWVFGYRVLEPKVAIADPVPTTQVPTTQAPTTQVPTTQAPTTQVPTTQVPTTVPAVTTDTADPAPATPNLPELPVLLYCESGAGIYAGGAYQLADPACGGPEPAQSSTYGPDELPQDRDVTVAPDGQSMTWTDQDGTRVKWVCPPGSDAPLAACVVTG